MLICEKCTKFRNGCECIPYDVECDENFEEKEVEENEEVQSSTQTRRD